MSVGIWLSCILELQQFALACYFHFCLLVLVEAPDTLIDASGWSLIGLPGRLLLWDCFPADWFVVGGMCFKFSLVFPVPNPQGVLRMWFGCTGVCTLQSTLEADEPKLLCLTGFTVAELKIDSGQDAKTDHLLNFTHQGFHHGLTHILSDILLCPDPICMPSV